MNAALISLCAAVFQAQLVPDALLRDMLDEISAATALEDTRVLSSRPRYPNSAAFFEAADYVAGRARDYGLKNVRIERFDGNPMWDAIEGELDLLEPEPRRLTSFRETPLAVAQRSAEGDVSGEVVDAGTGTRLSDYENLDLGGKIVLARDAPGAAVWTEAAKRGATGLITCPSPTFFGRRTPLDSVAWTRAPEPAIAMTISPNQCAALARLMRDGRKIRMRLRVKVKRSEPGAIGQLMGEIPGTIVGQDVVIVAHLDHPAPSANDNASGSAAILEALRVLQRLVAAGKISAPRRTIRFWWSTEISSEQEYFRKHPDDAKAILLAVNLDQAGGDRNAENNLIAIYGPQWLPSWADDLVYNLAEHVRQRYAPAEKEPSPLLVAPNGSKQSMRTVYWDYAPLSDHMAFESKEVGIPAISLAVPSLHVIHSSMDTPDRIDTTWLKRSTLMVLASAVFTANADRKETEALLDYVFQRAMVRVAEAADKRKQLEIEEKRLDSVRSLDSGVATDPYKKKLRAIVEALGLSAP